ncbi:bifunctional polysaccharide deacetylase/glycosyltransferase family 2 protein [Streptomyces winkii]|uniref:bifunctional polysaccharide deacetylase/glycosyltransferase family 2 protein n=1 Tax=Streptomyces winkii TaxID=3051178 RepID=UPI0028D5025E|nr:bifunctional polysaccharide deacetylase/glycosyltransferase family 2 protein [Streptomyces sp. DSM 40971]
MTSTVPRARHAKPGQLSAARRPALFGPRAVLALLALLGLVGVMLFNGYLHAELGDDKRVRENASSDRVPQRVLNGGSMLWFPHGKARSRAVPRKTVALTFDDGPDPRWTPKVLAVLEKYDVPGTFFVVGSMTARYPGTVRDIVDGGNEVGVHTFTHVDLSYQSAQRVEREMAQTQLALAGAAGVNTSLFRAPYSSTPDAVDDYSWPVYRRLGTRGYTSSFVDTDSEDWQSPGVSKIVENATPKGAKGTSVLFHDSGGDRSQTVAALPRYIEKMKARGYTFTTVSQAMRRPSAHRQVTGAPLWQGKALVAATAVAEFTMPALVVGLTVVGVAVLGRSALMLVLARRHHRQRNSRGFFWGPRVVEPVSVIVPAYNEKECIAGTVTSLARSTHPIEIIVVDDGSTDGTPEIVEALGLRNVRVVRQENAGKAAALNRGIAQARWGIVVMMDGDTVFEPDTVHTLVQPFADPSVGAVAGNAKVGNRRTLIGAWQHIEYVMGFNLDRRMYDLLRCMPTIPGAVGAFRREALAHTGGMSEGTLAEDTDVTIALQRSGWRVVYAEHAVAWTEAPGSMRQLWRQRYRWSYGTMQALWKHRRSVLDRGPAGRFGRVGLPMVVLFQILTPLLAPLIDLFTLYAAIFIDPLKSLAAWGLVLAIQLVSTAYAFRLDGEKYRYLLMLPLQQIVYRQLMYLVLIHSCITAATGGRMRWQKLKRTGEVGALSAG